MLMMMFRPFPLQMRMQQTWAPPAGYTLDDVSEECQANFEAIVDKAMYYGINHFETAKGYGCSGKCLSLPCVSLLVLLLLLLLQCRVGVVNGHYCLTHNA